MLPSLPSPLLSPRTHLEPDPKPQIIELSSTMYHTVREGSEEGAPGGAEDTEAAEKKTSIRLRRTKRDCAKWGETREGERERTKKKKGKEGEGGGGGGAQPTTVVAAGGFIHPRVRDERAAATDERGRTHTRRTRTKKNITTIERAQNRNKIEKHK